MHEKSPQQAHTSSFEGGSEVTAELDGLDLLDLEANGAGSMFHLELPEPSRIVPIRLAGSGSEFTVRRPAGVAARVHLKGWGSEVKFDGQTGGGVGVDVRLQSPNYDGSTRRYDLEASGSGSMIAITSA